MKNLGFLGFPNYAVTIEGEVFSSNCNRYLKKFLNGGGYYFVMPCANAEYKNITLHRLVALAYIPNDNPSEKTQVNHKDGNKLNNHINNLEWCTPSENTIHSNTSGIRKIPFSTEETLYPEDRDVIHDWKDHGKQISQWSEYDAHRCAKLLEEGYRVCDVSGMTGLCRRSIQKVRDGKGIWGHLALEYDFSKLRRKEKTSVETVVNICKLLQDKLSINEVSRRLNIERKVVSGIFNRRTHKSISDNYEW